MVKQKVQLRITEVNRARRRVVGSIRSVADEARKAAQDAIWSSVEVGKRYTGTVKSMTSYGVFVDIGGVDGMVHISELSWSRIKTPSEVCKVGDTMEVYVIGFDAEKRGEISLGVKDQRRLISSGSVHGQVQRGRCGLCPRRQADELRRLR